MKDAYQKLMRDLTVEQNNHILRRPHTQQPVTLSAEQERDLRRLIGLLNEVTNREGTE